MNFHRQQFSANLTLKRYALNVIKKENLFKVRLSRHLYPFLFVPFRIHNTISAAHSLAPLFTTRQIVNPLLQLPSCVSVFIKKSQTQQYLRQIAGKPVMNYLGFGGRVVGN